MRTGPGWVEPEVWFRIVHVSQVGHNGAPVATYREQSVEIAPGPMGRSKSPTSAPSSYEHPPVVELLRKAIEWKALIESGKIVTGRNDGSDKNVHISKSRKGVISVPDSMIRISRHQ
jgi:hypothetical protein